MAGQSTEKSLRLTRARPGLSNTTTFSRGRRVLRVTPQSPQVWRLLLLSALLDHRLAPQTNPTLLCTFLSSLVRTQEDFPVGHPS
jgi:hypothetical protein